MKSQKFITKYWKLIKQKINKIKQVSQVINKKIKPIKSICQKYTINRNTISS